VEESGTEWRGYFRFARKESSMAIGNEEELFSEASGELRTEVEDALDRACESLPDHESLDLAPI
jgi:chromosome condensin MukBEF complex kleisin-like MukF subunit